MRHLLLSVACCLSATLMAAEHPRLLITVSDLPALKAKLQQEPFSSMVEHLKQTAEGGQSGNGPMDGAWGESTNALRCAALYAATGDDAWAKKARTYTELRINDAGDNGWAKNVKGLRLSFHGKNIAMAYDLCHGAPSWDAAFSATVSKKLLEEANFLFENGGTQQNNSPASNWQANRFAAAGLCYLATDESYPAERVAQSHQRVMRYLSENMGGGKRNSGWNIEGLGYMGYPWGHLGPFLIANVHNDPKGGDARLESPAVQRALWTPYAVLTKVGGVWARPDFGDDNPGVEGNGAFGMAFHFCDPALLPGIKYVYDRTFGPKGDKTFEQDRAGTIFSLLEYGAKLPEAEPLGIAAWRDAFMDRDGNGFYTWRDGYRLDGSDSVAQFYVKQRGNRGHNGPDALSFRILGLNSAWAVGGGRYGKGNVYFQSMDTVYPVDPGSVNKVSEGSGKVVGEPLVRADGSGHLVAEIGTSNVGTQKQRRWFISDFGSVDQPGANYIIGDTTANGRFWQMCTLESHGVAIAGNTFTITGNDGATMKGTVIVPANAKLTTGTRARGSDYFTEKNNRWILCEGTGDFLVVLTSVPTGGTHPAVVAAGTAVLQTVKIGAFSATLTADGVSYP